MEIGLAPECVHTDPREKRYYLMKRFVRAAVKYAERVQKTTVKIVAFLYETYPTRAAGNPGVRWSA